MAAAAVCHPPLAFAVRWPCCASGAGGVPTRTAAAASSCGRAVAPTTAPRACSRCASVAGRRCGWAGGGGARAPMAGATSSGLLLRHPRLQRWCRPRRSNGRWRVTPRRCSRLPRTARSTRGPSSHQAISGSGSGRGRLSGGGRRSACTPGRGCRAACSGAARARFRFRAPTPPLPALRGVSIYVRRHGVGTHVVVDGASENCPFSVPRCCASYANHSRSPNARLELWPVLRPAPCELRQHVSSRRTGRATASRNSL